MDKHKLNTTDDWREIRRLRAWELKQKGWKQTAIAEGLGVSKGAVSQWLKVAREKGVEGLSKRYGGGPKRRLDDEQIGRLPRLLAQGAEHFGFRGDIWTRGRVRQVIQQEWGVTYSLMQVGRILKRIAWTVQKPIARASQRDEAAIEAWRTTIWPRLEKKRRKKDEQSCL